MKIELRHFGKVLPNGNISFYNSELWEEQRKSLAGKEFELVIKENRMRAQLDFPEAQCHVQLCADVAR